MICCRLAVALLLVVSSLAESQTPRKPAPPAAKPSEDAQVYRNAAFGFRFEVPYGWVDRTREMGERDATQSSDEKSSDGRSSDEKSSDKESPAEKTEKSGAKGKAVNNGNGEVLLAVFERPPEASGSTVNSAVVIASESAAAYPGLKDAVDYIAPLSELTASNGFKIEGDPVSLDIDSRELVCVSFSKPLSETLTMRQSTLILLTKGRIVSFTFIAGSEDEVETLIDGLHFSAARTGGH